MYQPRKIENKYGDLLYLNSTFEYYHESYSPDQPVALKMRNPISLPFHDFSFAFLQDSHFIYLNQRALKELPPLNAKGFIESSIVVLCCINQNNRYYILVKDKFKKYLTCPGGSKINEDETFLECACRELKEETSIVCNQLKEFGTYVHRHTMFSMHLNGLTKIFYGCIDVTLEMLQSIKNFTNNEIEKVLLISSNQLDELVHNKSFQEEKKNYKYYRHHIVFMKYMDMYYQKFNYDWIKDIDQGFRSDLFLY